LLVPVIGFMFLMMLINAPRLFATGWDSFWLHWDRVGPQFAHGQSARGLMSILQMVVLVLPAAGLLYTTARVVERVGSGGWHWSAGSALRRGSLVAGAGAAAALAAFLLWPNHDYRPIQPGERGTLAGAFKQIANVPSGRASLTAQRAQQLGGAPTERQLQRDGRKRAPVSSQPASSKGRANATQQQSPAGSPQASPQPQDTSTTPQQAPAAGQTQPQDTSTTPQQAPPPAQAQTTDTQPQQAPPTMNGSGQTTTPQPTP
jgi:hypothetical protein